MTDLETMKGLLKKASIEFAESTVQAKIDDPKITRLHIERGYPGFFTVMDFDVAGALQDVSAWE